MAKKKKGILGGLIKFAKDLDKSISTSKITHIVLLTGNGKRRKASLGN